MSHTKGPWIIASDGAYRQAVISNDSNTAICDQVGGKNIDELAANAKLIAAAPELLEALKEAKEVLLQLDHRHNGKCYNPTESDCNCTLCRIDKVIKTAL